MGRRAPRARDQRWPMCAGVGDLDAIWPTLTPSLRSPSPSRQSSPPSRLLCIPGAYTLLAAAGNTLESRTQRTRQRGTPLAFVPNPAAWPAQLRRSCQGALHHIQFRNLDLTEKYSNIYPLLLHSRDGVSALAAGTPGADTAVQVQRCASLLDRVSAAEQHDPFARDASRYRREDRCGGQAAG